MKNPKSLICAIFGVLFLFAALVLRGTGNGELVFVSVVTGALLLLAAYHIHKDPEYYEDDDEDE